LLIDVRKMMIGIGFDAINWQLLTVPENCTADNWQNVVDPLRIEEELWLTTIPDGSDISQYPLRPHGWTDDGIKQFVANIGDMLQWGRDDDISAIQSNYRMFAHAMRDFFSLRTGITWAGYAYNTHGVNLENMQFTGTPVSPYKIYRTHVTKALGVYSRRDSPASEPNIAVQADTQAKLLEEIDLIMASFANWGNNSQQSMNFSETFDANMEALMRQMYHAGAISVHREVSDKGRLIDMFAELLYTKPALMYLVEYLVAQPPNALSAHNRAVLQQSLRAIRRVDSSDED